MSSLIYLLSWRCVLQLVFCIAATLLLTSNGCHTPPWRQAAVELDYVADYLDEWGYATTSEPLLVENTGQFALNDLNRSTVDYIDAARTGVGGSIRRSFEQARDTQTAVRLKADIDRLLAELAAPGVTSAVAATLDSATGAGPDSDNAAGEGGEPDQTDPAFSSDLPLDRPAKATLSNNKFTKLLELGPMPAGLTERQSLIVGVNDKVTENILKYLVNPGQGVGDNKRVFIGVLQVSIQPGWRTRQGYIADINIVPFYARQGANGREFSRKSNVRAQPFVISAFPSLEAQTLDLRSSIRSQIATATYIAALLEFAGSSLQAEQLRDEIKRLEYDAATRNPIPIISSYSNGASFGYQVRPTFQALVDPADRRSQPGNLLQPVSFPALVVFICDKDELEPQNAGGQGWNEIELLVNSRWVPADNSGKRITFSESKRAKVAHHLNEANRLIFHSDIWKMYHENTSSRTALELRGRYNMYESIGVGVTRYSLIPVRNPRIAREPGSATITSIYPSVGWKNADTVISIEGTNFAHQGQSIVRQVTVGGVPVDYVVTGKGTLVAIVPQGSFNDQTADTAVANLPVTITTTMNVVAATNAISFTKLRAERPSPQAKPSISLKRDVAGRVTDIEVAPNGGAVTAESMLEQIRWVLESEQCSDDVKVRLKFEVAEADPASKPSGNK